MVARNVFTSVEEYQAIPGYSKIEQSFSKGVYLIYFMQPFTEDDYHTKWRFLKASFEAALRNPQVEQSFQALYKSHHSIGYIGDIAHMSLP